MNLTFKWHTVYTNISIIFKIKLLIFSKSVIVHIFWWSNFKIYLFLQIFEYKEKEIITKTQSQNACFFLSVHYQMHEYIQFTQSSENAQQNWQAHA